MIKEYTLKNYIARISYLLEHLRLIFGKILLFLNHKFNAANLFANFTSYLTDISPNVGRIFANETVKYLFANSLLLNLQLKKCQHISQKTPLNKVLIISDLNIGDAVNIQTAALFLKNIGANHIDYAINKTAYPLIKHNPNISNVFAIFNRPNFVSTDEINYLNNTIKQNNYDLILNFCPFLNKQSINAKNFINYMGLSVYVANTYFNQNTMSHITYTIHHYLNKIFNTNLVFEKNYLYLSSYSIQEAKKIHDKIPKNHKTIFFNIDATSIYTLVPIELQLRILEQLSNSKNVSIILGASFSQKNLQEKIYNLLQNKQHIILLNKTLPIDTFASLIDFCDCFVSSDTGGLHVASCYKFDESGNPLRNKTAIFSIFGATPARIYAYDSQKNDFLESSQYALSKAYISNSPCKNITCINKAAKKCKNVRCFYGINYEDIVSDIKTYLGLNA
ncbi:MAG: glycosyltransferase family 9 protein [Desulfurella sp.]|jgi:ADP-heptose:LPS heptosyltransferase